MEKNKTIEVCRSYSQKVSNPKNRYENSDFFCSAKMEMAEKDIKKVSKKLDKFVQEEVLKSVAKWQEENTLEAPKEELKYEPIKPEDREALQKEEDRIIAEGETDEEKRKKAGSRRNGKPDNVAKRFIKVA